MDDAIIHISRPDTGASPVLATEVQSFDIYVFGKRGGWQIGKASIIISWDFWESPKLL